MKLATKFLKAMDALPELVSTPAPWGIAKSGVSLNLPLEYGGQKIRFENRSERTAGDARIVSCAPANANLAVEALWTICVLIDCGGRRKENHDDVNNTLAMLAQSIAWLRQAPDSGRAFYRALGLALDPKGFPIALEASQRAIWPKPEKAAKARKRRRAAAKKAQGKLF